jgi:transcriptional/translational regulatory protein YebC/TACO1
MFTKKGIFHIEKSQVPEDKLMELALDAGAEDVETSEEGYVVTTAVGDYEKVKKALQDAKIELLHADLAMLPSQSVPLSPEHAERLQKIVDGLEDHDDVQNVYTNAE